MFMHVPLLLKNVPEVVNKLLTYCYPTLDSTEKTTKVLSTKLPCHKMSSVTADRRDED